MTIDYSMLIKLYGEPSSSPEATRRYSPAECDIRSKRFLQGAQIGLVTIGCELYPVH
jgi:hypothetical protein